MIPSGESVVRPGDHIIIVARRDAVAQVEKFLTVKLEYF
jgi:Trk K+ transport system NAD-binding subunit